MLGGRCFLQCFMGSMAALIQQPGRLSQLDLKCHGVYDIVSAALTAVLTMHMHAPWLKAPLLPLCTLLSSEPACSWLHHLVGQA